MNSRRRLPPRTSTGCRCFPAGRCCLAGARSRVAAGRGLSRRQRLGQRLPEAGVALFRPHRRAVAAPHRVAARNCRPDRSGAVRSRDARVAAGRAGRGLRLSRGVFRAHASADPRAAGGTRRARRRGSAPARGEATGDRRGRRRALQRWRRRGLARVRGNPSRAGGRDAGRQERAALGPPPAGGPRRRHRRDVREHTGA